MPLLRRRPGSGDPGRRDAGPLSIRSIGYAAVSEGAVSARDVVLAVLGAVVLVLVPAYDGPLAEMVASYGGNVAASFALYFAALNATRRYRWPRPLAASATLLAVELFEATDGFGVMANTYDSMDFVANGAGVGLAVLVDVVTTPIVRRRQSPDPALRWPPPRLRG